MKKNIKLYTPTNKFAFTIGRVIGFLYFRVIKPASYYVFMTALLLAFLASIYSSVYVAKIAKENNTEIKTVQEQLVDVNYRLAK